MNLIAKHVLRYFLEPVVSRGRRFGYTGLADEFDPAEGAPYGLGIITDLAFLDYGSHNDFGALTIGLVRGSFFYFNRKSNDHRWSEKALCENLQIQKLSDSDNQLKKTRTL